MHLLTAIIRPERLDFVKKALEDRGISGMTITEVRGRGEQKGIALQYRRRTMSVDMLPKYRVEVAVDDCLVDTAIEAICAGARTGKVGDGKIFVLPIARTIRVRTGEELTDGPAPDAEDEDPSSSAPTNPI